MAGLFSTHWVRFSLEVRDASGRIAYVDPAEWADSERAWMSGTDSMRQSMIVFRDRFHAVSV
jgi:hypothetical protein